MNSNEEMQVEEQTEEKPISFHELEIDDRILKVSYENLYVRGYNERVFLLLKKKKQKPKDLLSRKTTARVNFKIELLELSELGVSDLFVFWVCLFNELGVLGLFIFGAWFVFFAEPAKRAEPSRKQLF